MGDDARREPDHIAQLDEHELFARALALGCALEVDKELENDAYWNVVRELQRRGTRAIFDEVSAALAGDARSAARRLACDVLGQLGYEHGRPYGAESLPLLARLLAEPIGDDVLRSAVLALGHLGTPDSAPFVVPHAGHPDADVRHAVAFSLPSIAGNDWLDAEDPAVLALIELTADTDAGVRDWATFGLGSLLYVDGDGIRRCLFARIDDADDDTRSEALVGLARRRARGVAPHVRDALAADTVGRLAVEAAALLGDESLHEPLERLAEWWDVDVALLAHARRQCDPTVIEATTALVAALLDTAASSNVVLAVSSELLPVGPMIDIEVHVEGTDAMYLLESLMQRASDAVEAAVAILLADRSPSS